MEKKRGNHNLAGVGGTGILFQGDRDKKSKS